MNMFIEVHNNYSMQFLRVRTFIKMQHLKRMVFETNFNQHTKNSSNSIGSLAKEIHMRGG